MTEHSPKDPVSLEDLKRVIDAVGTEPFSDGDYFTTARLCSWQSRRADAWRTAFEWREALGPKIRFAAEYDTCNGRPYEELRTEEDEGMALIRRKLT